MSDVMTTTLTLLRRSEDALTLLDDLRNPPLTGFVYIEFTETWEKDHGNKRLISRTATGRRFEYDRRIEERDEDDWSIGCASSSSEKQTAAELYFRGCLVPFCTDLILSTTVITTDTLISKIEEAR